MIMVKHTVSWEGDTHAWMNQGAMISAASRGCENTGGKLGLFWSKCIAVTMDRNYYWERLVVRCSILNADTQVQSNQNFVNTGYHAPLHLFFLCKIERSLSYCVPWVRLFLTSQLKIRVMLTSEVTIWSRTKAKSSLTVLNSFRAVSSFCDRNSIASS